MTTRIRFWIVLLLVVCACQGAGRAQQGETKLGIPITTLPYPISQPGVYVLTQDFGPLNMGSEAAITINASDVVLDLNGHTLSNDYGADTLAYGVYAADRSNVTVRNGTVQGFMTGVALVAGANSLVSGSYGHVVEKLNVNACTYEGISVVGNDSTVRSCQVSNIGGSSLLDDLASAYGIELSGNGLRCLDCDVSQVTASGLMGISYAIYLSGASDAFVVNNRMSTAGYGIYFDGAASGQYRSNLATGMLTQGFVGGTDVGKNVVDVNGNGIDDDWEHKYNLPANFDPDGMAVGDLTYRDKYKYGLNPLVASTAGDGISDGWKIQYGYPPTKSIASQDDDGDGLTNFEEWQLHTNPRGGTSPDPTNFRIVSNSDGSLDYFWENNAQGAEYNRVVLHRDDGTKRFWLLPPNATKFHINREERWPNLP